MGFVWENLWKQNEVVGKAANSAMAQWMGCNFSVVQWAGIQFWCNAAGKA